MGSSGRRFLQADNFRRPIGYLAVFSLISLAIIQAGFQFHDVYRPLSSYQFKSRLFSSVQEKLGAISFLPVPLPYSYLQGLDWVVFEDSTGEGHGRVYLLGERRQGDGFPSYYLIAVLFKVPIGGLILFGAAVAHLWRKGKWRAFWRNDVFLLVPSLFFFLYLSFFFNTQIGLRYLLPAFPLVFIFCGRLTSDWRGLGARRKILPVLLVLYFAVSSLSYHPHYLSSLLSG